MDEVWPLVYKELRRLAAAQLRQERRDHTLQPTALVHEAYLRLLKEREGNLLSKAAFMQAAAQTMRRVLVDHARRFGCTKRGGRQIKLSLNDAIIVATEQAPILLALDDSLKRLAALEPRLSRIVELRFFAGLDVDETAQVLNVSPKTVKRDWSLAKVWLYGELNNQHGDHIHQMAARKTAL